MVKKTKSPSIEQTAKAARRAARDSAQSAMDTAQELGNRATQVASAAAERLLDTQLASAVKESAQQIWLAGMGAFSKAQEEGTKVFETLVKEGLHLQRKTQGLAEEKISEVTGRMSAMAGTVSAKAGQNWDKLEAIFEARTAKALNKLGVPTAKDVLALVERVDELASAVARLSKSAASRAAARVETGARRVRRSTAAGSSNGRGKAAAGAASNGTATARSRKASSSVKAAAGKAAKAVRTTATRARKSAAATTRARKATAAR